jgi:hypothetical protein
MMNEAFANWSAQYGLPEDQLKYVFCLLVAILLGFVFPLLPRSAHALKHIFSIAVSVWFCWFCMGTYSWLHPLISSGVAYLFMNFLPHGIAHQVVFVWMMAYVSAVHIYRMSLDWMGWSLDITGPQMILTIKVTSAAIDYFDGNRPAAEKEKMSEFQKQHRIEKLPGLLEWFGFVFFFPSFLAGPAVFIRDYRSFIDKSMFKDCEGGKPPGVARAVLKPLGQGLLTLPFVLGSLALFPPLYLTTEKYFNAPLWERYVRLIVHVTLCRAKYYFGWYLAEASFTATGFSYNGRDKNGHVKWDRVTNCYPVRVEFASNIRSITDNWNVFTAIWLKNYIYFRFPDQRSFLPTVVTYACSAFWHGFYPGYYLFFLHAAVLTEVGKMLRRKVRPLFMKDETTPNYPAKYLYDLGGTIAVMSIIDYAGCSFILLEFGPVFQIWKSVYFYGHVLALVGYVVMAYIWPSPHRPASAASTTAPKKAQ